MYFFGLSGRWSYEWEREGGRGEGGGAYNRNRGVYGSESINPPQPGAANLIVRPNQKQKNLTCAE